jgi:aromatic-L-amino-acid decarboxylase
MNHVSASTPIQSLSPLELNSNTIREISSYVTEKIITYLESLPDQPVCNTEDSEVVAASLLEPLPESGETYKELVDLIFDKAITKGYNSASPGYMAFIPGGGLVHSAIADLISDAINRYVGIWVAAPGLVQIETNVVRWFCDIVGYTNDAGGFLTTGGSLANFSALFTARRTRLSENFQSGKIYTSDQAHHSVFKAAILAGFPQSAIRIIPSDSSFRIDLGRLHKEIRKDRRTGFHPFAVVAHAGTTNTGAVDDLERIADISEKENLWLHIDAAYGGFFLLTEQGKQRMKGMSRADSITLDPHKGLFLPYGTGCLLARNSETLRKAHATHACYLPPMQDKEGRVDFCEISPELSRDFRGLRAWLPIKMHGIDVFRKALDEKLELARWIADQLESLPDIRIVTQPQLSVVTFRIRSFETEPSRINAQTQHLLERINAYGRVFLTGTLLAGIFVIRICILSFRTDRNRVETCLRDIKKACLELDSSTSNES